MSQGQYICYMCGMHYGRHNLGCPQEPVNRIKSFLSAEGDPVTGYDPVVATFNTGTWTREETDRAAEALLAARSSALVGPCPVIDYRTASWFEINEELKRKDKTVKDQAKVREEHKRIGDTERNRYLDYLASRFASGHLTQDEFDDRKDQALTARTQLDLDILVRDLPPMPAPSAPVATQPSALAKQKKRGITNAQVVYWVSLAALWCCILVILSLVITG